MKRIHNASWCCDEIEELIESYKNKCEILRSINERTARAQAEVYCNVIRDLETILYGETNYE